MITFWSIVLGLVQGVTEFFPVSSSGHLALLPWIFNFKDPGLAFDIALHAGTFFAILVALKEDWIMMIKSIFNPKDVKERKLIFYLVLTSIPAGLFGVFLEEKIATVFRNPLLTATVLVVFGFILVATDFLIKKAESLDKMNPSRALAIGFSQALALVPGVSRSGVTITAARGLGFSRESAVRYSFLAALPVIAGASIFGLRDVNPKELISLPWLLGFAAAFVSSFWAIRFLTKYVQKHDFKIFLYWRFLLAAVVLIMYFIRR